MQADTTERIDLYRPAVLGVMERLEELLDARRADRLVWAGLKAVYSRLIAGRSDRELAETFFNSISRRVFHQSAIDPDIEFVEPDVDAHPASRDGAIHRTLTGTMAEQIDQMLQVADLRTELAHRDRDVSLVDERVAGHLQAVGVAAIAIEVVAATFFREQGAYRVGRIVCDGGLVPLVLALRHTDGGLMVDAVLMDENDISILFSFARAQFLVDIEPTYELVRFLKSLMPSKRSGELYISVGQQRHGKTELYRDTLDHLVSTTDRFAAAPGITGTVMIVFVLPRHDLVFKVIRDRFPPAKSVTRTQIKERYSFVFRSGRAGRLVEAHEFENLRFDRSRFEEDLLAELTAAASNTIRVEGDSVLIEHAYVERRVTPLDIFMANADSSSLERVTAEYAQTIEDLALADVFCGDILPKNFGVTRHGRVVFYDYDELTTVTKMRFRVIPQPRFAEDDLANEPWYGVGTNDVFPEEWPSYLGLSRQALRVLREGHQHLFEARFWRDVQQRISEGEDIEILPYANKLRMAASRLSSGGR